MSDALKEDGEIIEFTKFDLEESILKNLKKAGYVTPSPIQEEALPHLLKDKDLLGIAQTGTGKTAAFLLPVLNRLARNKKRTTEGKTRVLIMTPTRELASQIEDSAKKYGRGLGLKSAVIFGGVNEKHQIKDMCRGVDILVATPGRLLDLMGGNHVDLSEVETLILDEADRMLDMGFIRDIERIVKKVPKQRQTLLFSATMPHEIVGLANSLLWKPVRIEVTPESTTVEKITQELMFVKKAYKKLLLREVLRKEQYNRVLVFTRTKHGANRLVGDLEKVSVKSAAIHGNKSQSARERALSAFKSGDIRILVATDIAARGIDVKGVSHVINFDMPSHPEDYVHRIGRTARAGREGKAISLCDDEEKKILKAIEKKISMSIPVVEPPPYRLQPKEKGTPGKASKNQNKNRRPLKKTQASGNKKRPSNFKKKPVKKS